MCESDSFSTVFFLEENFIPHDEVRVIIVRKDGSLVSDFIIPLAQKRNSRATQFNDQGIFIYDFVVALSQLALNFHAKTDEFKNFFFVEQLFHSRYELDFSDLAQLDASVPTIDK